MGKERVVLALCGSFNPITYMHLRLLGRLSPYNQGVAHVMKSVVNGCLITDV